MGEKPILKPIPIGSKPVYVGEGVRFRMDWADPIHHPLVWEETGKNGRLQERMEIRFIGTILDDDGEWADRPTCLVFRGMEWKALQASLAAQASNPFVVFDPKELDSWYASCTGPGQIEVIRI
jgi:hypothetical protein